jgi:predicted amidohydrolase YtcJ
VHLSATGALDTGVDLRETKSAKEALSILKSFVQESSNSFILGHGWEDTNWPDRQDWNLDSLEPDLVGRNVYLSRIDGYTSANGNSADFITYSNTTYSSTGVVQYTQQAPFTNSYNSQRVMPRPFLEKTDIVLRFKSSANTYVVAIAAEGYLIPNNNNVTGVGS